MGRLSPGKEGSADRPLTAPRVRCSEVGQAGPRWAYFQPKCGPSFLPEPLCSLEQPTYPLPILHPGSSASRQLPQLSGLPSLPWAPQSPEGLHGNETVSAGKPVEAWAGKRHFPSRDLQALGFESQFCIY